MYCIMCLAEGKRTEATKQYYGYSLCDRHYRVVVEKGVDPEDLELYVIEALRRLEGYVE